MRPIPENFRVDYLAKVTQVYKIHEPRTKPTSKPCFQTYHGLEVQAGQCAKQTVQYEDRMM